MLLKFLNSLFVRISCKKECFEVGLDALKKRRVLILHRKVLINNILQHYRN